jgi:hypothetical protein
MRLHSETIAVVSAAEGARFSLIELGAAENSNRACAEWRTSMGRRRRQSPRARSSFGNNHDLTAVGLQFRIASQFACADAGAIDDHIKIARNFLHLINMSRLNCCRRRCGTGCQVIEVDRGVDQRDVEGVAVGKMEGKAGILRDPSTSLGMTEMGRAPRFLAQSGIGIWPTRVNCQISSIETPLSRIARELAESFHK